MSIHLFYDQWPQYNKRLTDVVARMSDGPLALRPDPTRAPVWAIVGHIAGTRIFWLCGVIGESGAETTPFGDPGGPGWEDDEDKPRDAAELVQALETTWSIVEGCLERWTPEMLGDTFERTKNEKRQTHSRTSILQRLVQPRRISLRRALTDLGDRGLPSSRPLGPGRAGARARPVRIAGRGVLRDEYWARIRASCLRRVRG